MRWVASQSSELFLAVALISHTLVVWLRLRVLLLCARLVLGLGGLAASVGADILGCDVV